MEKINVGVIGLRKGMVHVTGFSECPDVRVAALCDLDEDKLSAGAENYPDAVTCTDYREMLNMQELDAVAVAVPNHLHASVSIDFLRAGKHVLCEKPMAMDAREAARMKETAETSGLILMLHFNMRFMSTGATLYPPAAEGAFGQIYHVMTTYTRRNGYPNPGTWFGQKAKSGGGPLIDLGVHRLDLALWLMGYPLPVSVLGITSNRLAAERMQGVEFDCEDFSASMITFENGASLYLVSSWDAHQACGSEITMNVYGTKASVFERDGRLTLCSGSAEKPLVRELEAKESEETPQEHFAAAIRNGTEPGPSAAHGLTVMRILDAIYESARTGREVRL